MSRLARISAVCSKLGHVLPIIAISFYGLAGYAQTVTGSGTTSYIPKWTGSTTLGNSVLFQTGGKIGIGTTTPSVDLDVNGRVNVAKSYRILGTDVLTVPGGINAENIALGYLALPSVGSGQANTALGAFALLGSTGSFNTAVGVVTLEENTTGGSNVAVGNAASRLASTGSYNTALGVESLFSNNVGSSNIAIGYLAGYYLAGSNNVVVANGGQAVDNGVVRIGTAGTQTSFFIAGVSGVPTGLNDAVPVVIDSNGQLGTINSSRRFKEDIQEMGDTSRGLMSLRPVTFRYRKAFSDGSKPMQYGLIAEDVEKVFPDLVVHSADGQVETVKYQVLDSMLLNEVQRQQKEILSLQDRLAKMEAAMASAEHRDK